ncbi:MAG: response regulator [Anaerolineae bacterium]
MKRDILVASSDEAFASVLKEQLEALGSYQVTIADSAHILLEKIATHPFDLLIVDVTLQDLSLPELLNQIRTSQPSLRIMAIPYPGNQVPFALKDMPVHGVLPKPFMTEELPSLVRRMFEAETALPLCQMAELYDPRIDVAEENDLFGLFVEEGSTHIENTREPDHQTDSQAQNIVWWDTGIEQPEQSPEETTILSEEALPILRALEHELQAVLVVLSSQARLLAYSGSLPRERAGDLCRFIARRVESGTQLMRLLGANDESIAVMLDEGEKHRMYTTRVTPTIWLTAVIEFHIPVGSVRYHIRKAVEQLADLPHKE